MIRAEPVSFEPPRAPTWARPSGSFRDHSEAEALFFAGAALSALDSVCQIRPAVGRRVAPPPGPEKRRRRGAEPAQPARGRGGARATPSPSRGPGRSSGRRDGSTPRSAMLADRGDPFRPERLAAVAADLQSPLDPQKAADLAAALTAGGRARAAGAGRCGRCGGGVTALRADAEPLAIWAADAALAKALNWPIACAFTRRRAAFAPRLERGTAASPGRSRLG